MFNNHKTKIYKKIKKNKKKKKLKKKNLNLVALANNAQFFDINTQIEIISNLLQIDIYNLN